MIEVSNLVFGYDRSKPMRFPDFTLQQGEHCLLLGGSGSGKTTLLHLLGGLLRGYEGSLKLDDVELASLSESQLDSFRGKNIGFIFQKNHLINALSVEKNVLMAPYLAGLITDKQKAKAILTEIGIGDKIHSRVTALSHGQAQRVAIARAILNEPRIILADEPTSALDDASCDRVIRLLMDVAVRHKATLLVATHDQRLKDKINKQVLLNS